MITRKQFSKLISDMEIGDKLIFTKSNGTELSIKKINILQYQVCGNTVSKTITNAFGNIFPKVYVSSNTVSKTITNPQYELLLED